ncbi:MAG: hypothetical protein HN341_11270 [Verrucomicrobia bacterium]|jgi:hypothetical protein|nr:hypothetical protein [Verrucomicrobiota bacterium]
MRTAVLGLLTLLTAGVVAARPLGLEVESGTKVFVVTEDLSDYAKEIGLTKELITNKVELQLRRNRIPVVTQKESDASSVYLYVNVNVMRRAFSYAVEFNRKVFYRVDGTLYSLKATTYTRGGVGTHGGDRNYLLQNVIDKVDQFSNDYLRSNPNLNPSNKTD